MDKNSIQALEARIGYWANLWINNQISDDKFFTQLERIEWVYEKKIFSFITDWTKYFDKETGELVGRTA